MATKESKAAQKKAQRKKSADAAADKMRSEFEDHAVSSWIFQIEQIAMTATRRETRILGFVGAEAGAGVSLMAEVMATSFAKSQRRTLLFDLRAPVEFSAAQTERWTPGAPDVMRHVEADPRGFHRLRPQPNASTRPLFNNVDLIRRTLDADLQNYEQIVVDLPNLSDSSAETINPIGPAVACDAVLLVCMTGRTTRTQALQAVDRLKTAGANVTGSILNDEENVSLGGDIAKFARRIRWLSPSFARRMERFGRTHTLLN